MISSFKRLTVASLLIFMISLPMLAPLHTADHLNHHHGELCVSCAVIDGSSKALNSTLNFAHSVVANLFDWSFEYVLPKLAPNTKKNARAPPSLVFS